ncbi:MAG: hypothetical protein H7X94_13630, partial [Vallitaleaceae bacterium]|nr:hypothetical protein [Vallitaleaceae bacterium]
MRSKCKTSTKDKLYRSLTCEMIEEINRLSEKSRRSPDRMNDQLYHYQADKSKCCKKIDDDPNHMEMREIERENRRLKGTNQTHFNEQRKSRNQLIKEIIEEELTQLSDVLMKK